MATRRLFILPGCKSGFLLLLGARWPVFHDAPGAEGQSLSEHGCLALCLSPSVCLAGLSRSLGFTAHVASALQGWSPCKTAPPLWAGGAGGAVMHPCFPYGYSRRQESEFCSTPPDIWEREGELPSFLFFGFFCFVGQSSKIVHVFFFFF